MSPLGTCVIVYDNPCNLTSWGHHGTTGWYIVPSLDHYRCMQCYIPATAIVRITDTLQYIPKSLALPKQITGYYLQQAIWDIIAIMKKPLNILPFLSYVDAKKNAINQISHILHINTSQPRVQILPLLPLLPQTQNETYQDQNTLSIPVAAPRVEPVLQPLTLQLLQTAPLPLHGLKHLQNIWSHLRSPKKEKHSRHPSKFNPDYAAPHVTSGKHLHLISTAPCHQPSLQLSTCFTNIH